MIKVLHKLRLLDLLPDWLAIALLVRDGRRLS